MTIYSSDKAAPYVYICTHKETNQFYIGYREANVKLNRPSHLDLPEYKTSSKIVNPDFHDYTWIILAEFFDPSHAYTFEQQLICDNWENPLLLNGHCNIGKNQFRVSGPSSYKGIKRGPNSDEHNQKISVALTGKTRSDEHCQNISDAMTGKTQSPETIKKRADSNRGKLSPKKGILTGPNGRKGKPGTPHTEKTKQKMRKPRGKQKIVECPHCGKEGGISVMKQKHFDNCPKKLLPSCRPIKDMPSNLFGSDNTGPTWIDCH